MAAANTFSITITAVDQATATIKAVNKGFQAMAKPVAVAGASLRNVVKTTGLDQLAKRVATVGTVAGDTALKIAKIVPPLATIAGFASIAGLAELATGWTRMGQEVTQTSRLLGVSTDQLQEWRAAAKLVGVDGKAVSASMGALSDTLQDAAYGRNQEALVAMSMLGVRLKRTKDGAIDTGAALTQLAGVFPRLNANQQRHVASIFGVTDMLPLLRQGPAALQRYMAQARAAGAIASPAQIKAAADLQQGLQMVQLRAQGLGNVVMERLAPVVGPLAAKFDSWARANQGVIGARVADFANGVADAVQRVDWSKVAADVAGFGSAVNGVVGFVGGWRNALIGVAIVMNASTIMAVGKLVGQLGGLAVMVGRVVLALGSQLALAAAEAASAVGAEGLSAAFLAFGAAIEATPVGWFLTAAVAIGAAAFLIIKNWKPISAFFGNLFGGLAKLVVSTFDPVIEKVKQVVGLVRGAAQWVGGLFKGGGSAPATPVTVRHELAPRPAGGPPPRPVVVVKAPPAQPRGPAPALAPVAIAAAAPKDNPVGVWFRRMFNDVAGRFTDFQGLVRRGFDDLQVYVGDAIDNLTRQAASAGSSRGGGGGGFGRIVQQFGKGFDAFVARITHQESGGHQFNRWGAVLRSAAGAIGAMQLLPATAMAAAHGLGVAWDANRFAHDAAYNTLLGKGELSRLLKRYGGDQTLAAAAYNAGAGNVDKWIGRFGDPRKGAISDRDFAARIPFKETRDYVALTAGSDILNSPAPGVAAPARTDVHVQLSGAPKGTKVTTKSGPGVKTTARIGHAMPGTLP